MPRLVILGKKSWFAGDDIRQLVFLGGIFGVIEIILSVPILIFVTTSDPAEQQFYDTIAECVLNIDDRRHSTAIEDIHDLTMAYAAISLVVAFVGLLEYVAMFCIAGKGNPTDNAPRKHLSMLCNINFTVVYFLRIASFVFGIFMASVFADYCQCEVAIGIVDDDSPTKRRGLSTAFRDVKDQCWMYREAWFVAFLGLVICQVIDFFFGIYKYFSLLCQYVPTKYIISAEATWECCCRCFVSFANCITCCTIGRLRAVGSSDTQEFATICSKFFTSDGILDIAFSDILAGLYVTRLIHGLCEESVRNQLIKDGLTEPLVKESLHHTVGTLEEKLGDIQAQLIKDGIIPSSEDPIQFVKNIEVKLLQPVKDQLGEDGIARKIGGEILQPVQAIKNMNQSNESQEKQAKDKDNDNREENSEEVGISNGIETTREKRSATKPHSGIDLERESTLEYFTNIQEANQFLIPLLNKALSLDNPEEKNLIAEGARYICFATGIYYWSTKDKEPWWYPPFCRRHHVQKHKSDHRGRALKASPIHNVEEDNIVYANYQATVVATPFAVVLDHAWKSVVITIRGSQSIDDWISDTAIVPIELAKAGEKYGFDGVDKYAHKGFLDRAEWITNDLFRSNILHELLLNENAEYKHYQLRIVGHSLGAGTGSLLALFLQSKFPNVRAVVFEPPGCTMSLNIAEESDEWCTSFVTGSDVVPRITASALITFRNEVLINLARIKVPKHVIMANRNIDRNGLDAVKEFLQEALYPHDEIPGNAFVDSVHEFFKHVHTTVEKKGTNDMLHLPGKIIHLASESYALQSSGEGPGEKKLKEAKEKKKRFDDDTAREESRKYQTCWAKRKDFRRIILSSHFMSDHFTDTITAAFEGRMKSTGMDRPYSEVILTVNILPSEQK